MQGRMLFFNNNQFSNDRNSSIHIIQKKVVPGKTSEIKIYSDEIAGAKKTPRNIVHTGHKEKLS